MSRIENVFGMPRVLLPVVHVVNHEQAMRNAHVAQDCGADGIFLISHGSLPATELRDLYDQVCGALPSFWIGTNFLDLNAVDAMEFIALRPRLQGLWIDDQIVVEDEAFQQQAEAVDNWRCRRSPDFLLFGSVLFKGQGPVKDPQKVIDLTRPYVDVLTTSGPGTGIAANPEKVAQIRKWAGDFPLALASGVTPGNVGDYLPSVDAYLVSTGISYRGEDNFNPRRVRQLADTIHAYRT